MSPLGKGQDLVLALFLFFSQSNTFTDSPNIYKRIDLYEIFKTMFCFKYAFGNVAMPYSLLFHDVTSCL